MSDRLTHECGLALIRLKKPLEWFQSELGDPLWALRRLYLLMEKQHNRGQDGAGIAVVKRDMPAGEPFIDRIRSAKRSPIERVFGEAMGPASKLEPEDLRRLHPTELKRRIPFLGELMLGHLRYGTHSGAGSNLCHPYLRRSNIASRNLALAGNFNLTNSGEIFRRLVQLGINPVGDADTGVILEKIGHFIDREHEFLASTAGPGSFRNLEGRELASVISQELDIARILRNATEGFDGGYVLGGIIGNGDAFVLRDANGIRPAFWVETAETIAVASERPALAAVFGVRPSDVQELTPGHALIMKADGRHSIESFHAPGETRSCSFERIYFSRGNDPEIYAERKALGAALADDVIAQIRDDHDNAVFSYIPNTAEIAWYGLMEELRKRRRSQVRDKLVDAQRAGKLDEALIDKLVLGGWPRGEKVAHKDVKLRTFISQEKNRMQMASHVYDISYGTVRDGDTLVCVDDSIVRGTTLRQSILRILARPNPKRIVIASTAPQIRYPDCYGIDMSEMGKFLAFQATVALCKERGKTDLLREVYEDCVAQSKKPTKEMQNHVKRIYAAFTEIEIAAKAAELVYPSKSTWKGELILVFQKIESLHKACPKSRGDWYFTGDYPTPGGLGVLNQAYINYWEKREGRSY